MDVEDVKKAIDEVCRLHPACKGYSCKSVSWDDVARTVSGSGLSCLGSNITDSRLWEKNGKLLYTVRSDNWNEKLGKVSAHDIKLIVGNTNPQTSGSLSTITLWDFLKNVGEYGSYAGLDSSISLLDELLDDEVSIRFQTTFLPLEDPKESPSNDQVETDKKKGTMEFCGEAYNYNTSSNDDPRNLLLLCTTQGFALNQNRTGSVQLFHHRLNSEGKLEQCWLEAESTRHKVGGEQEESQEAVQEAKKIVEQQTEAAAQVEKRVQEAQSSGNIDEDEVAQLKEAAKRSAERLQKAQEEAKESEEKFQEAEKAREEGKATSASIGTNAMGTRCNVLMTIQIPLEVQPRPIQPSFSYLSKPKEQLGKYGKTVGISLGNSYSSVAIWQNDKVEVIPNEMGNRRLRSSVCFTENERLVGDFADASKTNFPEGYVGSLMKYIGKKYSDLDQELIDNCVPLEVQPNGFFKMKVKYAGEEKQFLPEELLAMIISELKKSAEEYLGDKVTHVVLTVPAYFNDSQRQATKDAGIIAGVNVMRVINEPTAALISVGADKTSYEEKKYIVVDLGGESFDVSIFCVEDGIFEVLGTGGDSKELGGRIFDEILTNHFVNEIKKSFGVDLRENKRAVNRLQRACESVKKSLSSSPSASLALDCLFEGKDYETTVSRGLFEHLVARSFEKCIKIIEQTLETTAVTKEQLSGVYLIGGCASIPLFKKMVENYFGEDLIRPLTVSPDLAVVRGAAIQAAILCDGSSFGACDLLLLDVSPLSLGIGTACGTNLLQPDVNPCFTKVIPRNTTIPTHKSADFVVTTNPTEDLRIDILEGERAKASENNLLGFVVLPKEVISENSVVNVKMDIDANGILKVTAGVAVKNGERMEKSVIITNDKGRLSQEEIEKMIQDAEKMKQNDSLFQLKMKGEVEGGEGRAGRVSCGSKANGEWVPLGKSNPKRGKQHCTVTVQLYNTITGGAPKLDNVVAAIKDMEILYENCEGWKGRLADSGAAFMQEDPFGVPVGAVGANPDAPFIDEVD